MLMAAGAKVRILQSNSFSTLRKFETTVTEWLDHWFVVQFQQNCTTLLDVLAAYEVNSKQRLEQFQVEALATI